MDDKTREALSQLVLALRAMAKSVDKSLYTQVFEATANMVVKGYRSLHARAAQLLPDDYYIKEVLVLEVPEKAGEKEQVSLVAMVINQLLDYLEGLLKADEKAQDKSQKVKSNPIGGIIMGDIDELSDLGRELHDQVIRMTRRSLHKAIRNMDNEAERHFERPRPPHPPRPPRPPRARPMWEDSHEHDMDVDADVDVDIDSGEDSDDVVRF